MRISDEPSHAPVRCLNGGERERAGRGHTTGAELDVQVEHVIAAMQAAGVRRLVVPSLGIYDEVPGKFGEWNNATLGEDLKPFRHQDHRVTAAAPARQRGREQAQYRRRQARVAATASGVNVLSRPDRRSRLGRVHHGIGPVTEKPGVPGLGGDRRLAVRENVRVVGAKAIECDASLRGKPMSLPCTASYREVSLSIRARDEREFVPQGNAQYAGKRQ
ncbi:NAD(P)H-binding protein [Cupriavidus necator]|uniref:NAD(P)H-binding protein n=1 Tax=Cupriavidus necator TaxID=106590 RepID=UPI001E4A6CA7|nr:NAD(P)H-binding protein [Cupriavidus necator]